MVMTFFLWSVGVLFGSSLAALLLRRHPGSGSIVGSTGGIVGSLFGLIAAVQALLSTDTAVLRFNMSLPGASFYLKIDALSAFFLLVLFLLSTITTIYGCEYLRRFQSTKAVGVHWGFYNSFLASMALALTAHNAILFLIAWEMMAIFSFFLVTFEHEQFNVRRAGFIYFVATNFGTACLLICFILLSRTNTVLDYENLGAAAGIANWVFLLALTGFGLKAGVVPLHVWLPEAHPAAPSHVSALMSGVMIKLGIYGLLRIIQILGTGPVWWGMLLVIMGALSGVLGVLFALGQHDLKRLLAYHSVENIGIIILGLGMGLIGLSYRLPVLVALGFGGGLLHVLNHALFKGLLFLGAGAVVQATETRNMELLGGLGRKMPLTAGCFLIGSVAISGLPPLNGFVSEFLVYASAFLGLMSWRSTPTPEIALIIASLLTAVSLALIGGLALACFAKVYGIVFLGEPRSAAAVQAKEPHWGMVLPLLLLSGACLAVGFLAFTFVPRLASVIALITGLSTVLLQMELQRFALALEQIARGGGVLLGLAALLTLGRWLFLRRRTLRSSGTWDCGYIDPSARMQYSASSFAQPLVNFFSFVLCPEQREVRFSTPFPRPVWFRSEVADVFVERIYNPAAAVLRQGLTKLRSLLPANVHFFAGYIIVTLLILILWNYFFGAAL